MASTQRNLVASLSGVFVPLLAAAVAIPLLLAQMGVARFGVLALLMAGTSYAAVLDLGLSSAVTYRLVRLSGQENAQDQGAATLRTAWVAVVLLGLAAMVVIVLAAPLLPALVPAADAALLREAVLAVQVLALSLPAILAASVLAGALAAHGHFVAINRVRTPVGVLVSLLPAIASLWSPSLVTACVILALLRVGQVAAHAWQCRRLLPREPAARPRASLPEFKALVRYGGWLTVSSVISPLMVYADRFYLGAMRSAQEVAWYVTPYEVATKIALIPGAIMPVLFTLFLGHAARPREGGDDLPVQGTLLVAIVCALPAAGLAVFAPEFLRLWLGGQLPSESAVVMQVLAAAVLVNCVAVVFFTQVQSSGRTDLIARLHAAELVGYLLVLAWMTQRWGIVGVALAWALRVVVDAAILCHVAARPLDARRRRQLWRVLLVTLAYGVGLASLPWVEGLWYRGLLLAAPLAAAWACRAGAAFPGRLA